MGKYESLEEIVANQIWGLKDEKVGWSQEIVYLKLWV